MPQYPYMYGQLIVSIFDKFCYSCRLKVTYTVKDETDSHLVTFWNVAAVQLVKKTAIQLLEELPEVRYNKLEFLFLHPIYCGLTISSLDITNSCCFRCWRVHLHFLKISNSKLGGVLSWNLSLTNTTKTTEGHVLLLLRPLSAKIF